MSKHRICHDNAFRAGGREGIRDFLADLLALTPPEAHDNVKRLAAGLMARPKYQRIERSSHDQR